MVSRKVLISVVVATVIVLIIAATTLGVLLSKTEKNVANSSGAIIAESFNQAATTLGVLLSKTRKNVANSSVINSSQTIIAESYNQAQFSNRYVIEIEVGTPPKKFRMLLDTGWRHFWIAGKQPQAGNVFRTLYSPSESSTYGGNVQSFSDPPHSLSGYETTERVRIGNTVLENIEIRVGETFGNDRWVAEVGFEGIIGLFPSGVLLKQLETRMPTLKKRFCFKTTDHSSKLWIKPFQFIIGDCETDIDLITMEMGWAWDRTPDSVRVIGAGVSETIDSSDSLWFDTGAPYIYFSGSVLRKIKKAVQRIDQSTFEVKFGDGQLKITVPHDNISKCVLSSVYPTIGATILRNKFLRFDWGESKFSIEKVDEYVAEKFRIAS